MAERLPGILLKDVELQWAYLREPKIEEDKAKYSADLCNLSKKQANELHKAGLEIRNGDELDKPKPEKGLFITAKTGIQPKIVDRDLVRLDGDEVPLVGNGSKANVFLRPWAWPEKYQTSGRSGMSAGLEQVQLLKVVPYENKEEDVFEVEDKYKGEDAEVRVDAPF